MREMRGSLGGLVRGLIAFGFSTRGAAFQDRRQDINCNADSLQQLQTLRSSTPLASARSGRQEDADEFVGAVF
jgi:hypothetical protein